MCFQQALDDYIIKKQPNAILDMVTDSLNRTQKALQQDKSADDKAAILKATSRVKEKAEEDLRKETGKKAVAVALRDQLGAARKAGAAAATGSDDDGSTAGRGKAKPKAASSQGKSKSGATAKANSSSRARGRARDASEASDDDFSVGNEDEIQHVELGAEDDGGMDVDSDDISAPAKGKGRGKGNTAAAAKAKPVAKATKRAAAPSKKAAVKESPAPSARNTGRRAATAKVGCFHDCENCLYRMVFTLDVACLCSRCGMRTAKKMAMTSPTEPTQTSVMV
jgi:hypothetical protein